MLTHAPAKKRGKKIKKLKKNKIKIKNK